MSRYENNRGANRPRSTRNGKSASLSDLHQVSPEMRERYGVSSNQSSRYSNPYDGDWRNPSVDPIGGRNLRGSSSRGGNGGNRGNRGSSQSGGGLNLPIIIGLAVVALLIIAIIVVAVGRCSGGQAEAPTQGTQTEQSASSTESGSSAAASDAASSVQASESGGSYNGIDKAKLTAVVDEEIADKLINRATTSEDAKWIAQNVDKYAMDGEAVQRKLLKLAADEPAAQQFVRNFPDKYPMQTPSDGKVTTVSTGINIPRFYQWDGLWGYTTYSGTAFGLTGCGPTCLAMVYQGITGNHDLSPYDMGELAVRDGYATEYEGTMASFLVDEAEMLNLPVTTLDVTEKALKNALQSHQAVIANFAPGIFTEYGHYVVISGMRQDGTLVMNDPYSEERSNKTWDIETIVNESQGLYAYG